jgi:LysR family glycine cleavage system transcriptional activator
MDGLGISIGQTYLLKADIDSGRLLKPFRQAVRRDPQGHYLVRSRLQRYSPKVERFREWLVFTVAREMAEEQAASVDR